MNLPLLIDFAATPLMLEGLMLACFGLAWPQANLRMLRTGRAEGKGLVFTLIILCGYLAGAAAKLLLANESTPLAPVFWLYLLNATSVCANLVLQWYYRHTATVRTLPAVSIAPAA